jgi:hypothetical protein
LRLINLTGMKFGKLTVLERVADHVKPSGQKQAMWKCVCECGMETVVSGGHLRGGHTKSCGCISRESFSKIIHKHGGTGTRLYGIWKGIRTRCKNQSYPRYDDWGGRGIKICNEWDDFENFRDWAVSSGYADTLTIDRIDNSGNYEPSNCRWVSRTEQMRNTRHNVNYTYGGKTLCLAEWCEITGTTYSRARGRLRKGMCFEDAFDLR